MMTNDEDDNDMMMIIKYDSPLLDSSSKIQICVEKPFHFFKDVPSNYQAQTIKASIKVLDSKAKI